MRITLVKVFSATKEREQASLGQKVKSWLAANPATRVVQTCLRLTSDEGTYCMSIVLFCAAA